MKHILLRKWALLTTSLVLGILPVTCERDVLQILTPFLLDGSNGTMADIILAAAPFVLP